MQQLSTFRLLGSLPGPVRLLILGTFVNRVGSFVVSFLALVLSREFHLAPNQVGLLMSAYGVGAIAAVLCGGILADRIGRRLTLLLSVSGSGVLALLLSASSSFTQFAVLLLVFGLVADLYRPAASSILADLLPSQDRATGYAGLRLAVNLGFAFGTAAGGFLADWNWRALFAGDGLTSLVFGAIVWAGVPETRRLAAASEPSAEEGTGPWQDRVFLLLCVTSLCWSVLFFSHLTALPLTVTAAGYAPWVYGLLVSVNGALIVLFEVPVTARLKDARRLRVARVGTALLGVGFALTAVSSHWSWTLLTVVLWTAGEVLTMPQLMSFIADWAPPRYRGRYMSVYQATWSLAFALNPALLLPLYGRLGPERFWPLSCLLALPGLLLLGGLDRRADRPERLRGVTAEAQAA